MSDDIGLFGPRVKRRRCEAPDQSVLNHQRPPSTPPPPQLQRSEDVTKALSNFKQTTTTGMNPHQADQNFTAPSKTQHPRRHRTVADSTDERCDGGARIPRLRCSELSRRLRLGVDRCSAGCGCAGLDISAAVHHTPRLPVGRKQAERRFGEEWNSRSLPPVIILVDSDSAIDNAARLHRLRRAAVIGECNWEADQCLCFAVVHQPRDSSSQSYL